MLQVVAQLQNGTHPFTNRKIFIVILYICKTNNTLNIT